MAKVQKAALPPNPEIGRKGGDRHGQNSEGQEDSAGKATQAQVPWRQTQDRARQAPSSFDAKLACIEAN